MSKRDEYIAKMKRQLDQWDAELDKLEARAQKSKADVRLKYYEQIGELRKKRRRSEQKLEEIRTAAEDSWEKLKGEIEHTWTAFKDSVNYFKSHFK